MLVVGGGVIGCEYACMFALLGIVVTVVEMRERVIDSLDREVSASLQEQMEGIGIRFCFNDSVEFLDAGTPLKVRLKSGLEMSPETILVVETPSRWGSTPSVSRPIAVAESQSTRNTKRAFPMFTPPVT